MKKEQALVIVEHLLKYVFLPLVVLTALSLVVGILLGNVNTDYLN